MKDTATNTWSCTFDPAGRQTRAADPDTGTLTTAWDASGRKASTTDAAGLAPRRPEAPGAASCGAPEPY